MAPYASAILTTAALALTHNPYHLKYTKTTRLSLYSRSQAVHLRNDAAQADADASRPQAFLGSTFGSNSALFYRQGTLVLEDGTRLRGVSFGAEVDVKGELVFTTAMCGYPESLTDPSYRGQLLVMTYPIIGNYGVPEDNVDEHGLPLAFESLDGAVNVAALIVSDYSHHHSHWNSDRSLSQWLTQQKVPALYGIDTRLLTKKIRERGALKANIEFDPPVAKVGGAPEPPTFVDSNARNLVAEVSIKEPRTFGKGNRWKVLAVDCGIKVNILRSLVSRGCEVTLVPWDTPLAPLMADYDGLFLSNGPGDPGKLSLVISHVKELVDAQLSGAAPTKPLFGICLGNQLLGSAAGASTFKLPFGNRGVNQPVLNLLNGRCFITSQNHGYALDPTNLPDGWVPAFQNRNDGSNEGIMHTTRPWMTAQFHPEAKAGPSDTFFLFDLFTDCMANPEEGQSSIARSLRLGAYTPPEPKPLKKVLLLGSGGLSIGQAGEFDYSGAQAIKALKEEGLEVILINPNIASVQTNVDGQGQEAANKVYLLPVTADVVEGILARDRPEGIILSMGGQTGLNCGLELEKRGILEKYGCRVLGTSTAAIEATEDRGIFSDKLNEIDERIAPSYACDTLEAAVEAAEEIGFPCMIRAAFALGGLGSGLCYSMAEFKDKVREGLASSPQLLVEKSLKGWKEVEYEVVRDMADNCITVCNMENFDPLGVHTGDSIVIAPSQTLTDDEYHMLRTTAIKVVRHLGIVGECNIQYALDPESQDYCIIEVNPRLSRSSALASKATGYPLAFVAAKLALGKLLPDLTNSVTQSTTACFEPSLDYIVCKVPRWDLAKFDRVSREIGSAMKSVGEVMAIGRSFEEALQKALRMTDPSVAGFATNSFDADATDDELSTALSVASDMRVHAIAQAMERGWSVERIHALTQIDPWFLWKLARINNIKTILDEFSAGTLTATTMLQAKKSGFSDKQIAARIGATESEVRTLRKGYGLTPFVKQIDTMAAEFPAATNYLYMTYNGDEHDLDFDDRGTLVIGSGVYRIGSSVEFDWCSVSAIRTLRELGKKAVMINYNPETVSTDYDECDRLYFEELSLERVLDVYDVEGCEQAIVSVGGQIPNTLALEMGETGVNVAGTSPTMIDSAEDRNKFSALCDRAGIDQPAWSMLTSQAEALRFTETTGFPVLVRPSYVLSGAAMNVAYTADELVGFLELAGEISGDKPVVISKYIENGREIDVDAVAQDGRVLVHTVSEHVENAGVHSGDATLMLPPQTLSADEVAKVADVTARMAEALQVTGPFNMQLIAKDGELKVIETNLRASRSCPFSSKVFGVNFIEIATRAMVGGEKLEPVVAPGASAPYVGVKAPMFSFQRLKGADPSLGVEMSSTGEVACFGPNKHDAFLNAMLSTGMKLPREKILVSMQEKLRSEAVPACRKLADLGYKLYGTEKTARFLQEQGIAVTLLHYAESNQQPCIDDYILNRELELVLMFSNQYSERVLTNYAIRRLTVDYGVPLITNVQVAQLFAESLEALSWRANSVTSESKALQLGTTLDIRSLQEWYEV